MTISLENDTLTRIQTLLNDYCHISDLNKHLEVTSGIMNFFESQSSLVEFKSFLSRVSTVSKEKRDMGDFQTSSSLADRICQFILSTGFKPDVVIEPTCGEGSFVVSVLRNIPSVKYAYCVDIQDKYEWLFKLNIFQSFLRKSVNSKIEFHRDNIFNHVFSGEFLSYLDSFQARILILGNPPWVTSSELSTLESKNLPSKLNIKGLRGIDAITGKANFDIAEYIILRMIQNFSNRKGMIAMLCKTTVVRNIVRDTQKLSLKISNVRELLIDAKKEFGINADGALFVADVDKGAESFCKVSSLYQPAKILKQYGWVEEKFVSNIELYDKFRYADGTSPFEWRQGVKHDASKVMVLKSTDGKLLNGLGEIVDVEQDLLYPFVRGSDLQAGLVRPTSDRIIITQKRPNQDTDYIETTYPLLWKYLTAHSEYFDKRKSKIYRGKAKFSIFGVGDYSFRPYKVAISGLYKNPSFCLVLPSNEKPTMLDDTSYFLSFDVFNDALFTWILLNTSDVKELLSSIAFLDLKRPYTKEILMRIDIRTIANAKRIDDVLRLYQQDLYRHQLGAFNKDDFADFQNRLERKHLKNSANREALLQTFSQESQR